MSSDPSDFLSDPGILAALFEEFEEDVSALWDNSIPDDQLLKVLLETEERYGDKIEDLSCWNDVSFDDHELRIAVEKIEARYCEFCLFEMNFSFIVQLLCVTFFYGHFQDHRTYDIFLSSSLAAVTVSPDKIDKSEVKDDKQEIPMPVDQCLAVVPKRSFKFHKLNEIKHCISPKAGQSVLSVIERPTPKAKT